MYLVAICILILKLEPSWSHSLPGDLFPKHTDLQKVGEVIFNNEKYNILRPTTHIISDYFKDFVLRRDSKDIPSNRLFVDDNSFRHYWTGFDRKTKSLRKTDLVDDDFDAIITENIKYDSAKTRVDKDTSEDNVNSNSNENVEKKSAEENRSDIENSGQKTTTEGRKDDIKVVNVSDGKINEATTAVPELRLGTDTPPSNGPERNIVKTTFFCPFFGVITMAAFVD